VVSLAVAEDVLMCWSRPRQPPPRSRRRGPSLRSANRLRQCGCCGTAGLHLGTRLGQRPSAEPQRSSRREMAGQPSPGCGRWARPGSGSAGCWRRCRGECWWHWAGAAGDQHGTLEGRGGGRCQQKSGFAGWVAGPGAGTASLWLWVTPSPAGRGLSSTPKPLCCPGGSGTGSQALASSVLAVRRPRGQESPC